MATMKTLGIAGQLGVLGLGLSLLGAPLSARAEIQLGTLQVGANTYHNVRVTSKSPNSIFIAHSKGFANVPVAEVDSEVLTKLGYNAERVKLRARSRPSGAR